MNEATEIGPSTAILRFRCSVSPCSSAIPCTLAFSCPTQLAPPARDHDQRQTGQHHGDRQDLAHGDVTAKQEAQLRVGLTEMLGEDPAQAVASEEDTAQRSGPVTNRRT